MVYQSKLRPGSKFAGLVVQVSGGVPDAQKERRPASQDQFNLREKGSTQFFEQGSPPCSFFWRCTSGVGSLKGLTFYILQFAIERSSPRARSGGMARRLSLATNARAPARASRLMKTLRRMHVAGTRRL